MTDVTQKDLEDIQTFIITYVENLLKDTKDLLDILGKSIEALDKQFATMAVGYVEQAVMLEALICIIPEDKRKDFFEYVTKKRKDMMDMMKAGNDVLSGDG